jgi:Tfp pilus assembly protein PilF
MTVCDAVQHAYQKGIIHRQLSRLLRHVLRRYPDDFWLHWRAARASNSCRPPRVEEDIYHLSAALALRPQSVEVLNEVGYTLNSQGKHDEAIAYFRRSEMTPVVDLRPRSNLRRRSRHP